MSDEPIRVLCSLLNLVFPNQGFAECRWGDPARIRGIIDKNLEILRKFPNIGGNFFPTVGSSGVISVYYQLPHRFVLAISYSVLCLVLFHPCSFRTVKR